MVALLGFEPRSLPLGGAVLQTAWWTITFNAMCLGAVDGSQTRSSTLARLRAFGTPLPPIRLENDPRCQRHPSRRYGLCWLHPLASPYAFLAQARSQWRESEDLNLTRQVLETQRIPDRLPCTVPSVDHGFKGMSRKPRVTPQEKLPPMPSEAPP